MNNNKSIWKQVFLYLIVLFLVVRISNLFIGQDSPTQIEVSEDYEQEYLLNQSKATDLLRESVEISIEIAKNKKPRPKEEIAKHINEIMILKKDILTKSNKSELIKLQIVGVSELSLAEKVSSYAYAHYGDKTDDYWLDLNEKALNDLERYEDEKIELFNELLLDSLHKENLKLVEDDSSKKADN